MKKYLILCVLVVAVLFAIPLSAKENAKIKLPDGLYMYDSWIEKIHNGDISVRFEKYFVVHRNNIYSSIQAYKKFGVSRLNTLFGGKKKYKILCGGEVVGTKYNLRFVKEEGVDIYDAYYFPDESYITKNINQGPAYGRKTIILGRLGSAVKCIAVPEEYKEKKKNVCITIPKEEVDKVSMLTGDKLFNLVKNRKEIARYKIIKRETDSETVILLDKISDQNIDSYIGLYHFVFKIAERDWRVFDITFSLKKDNVNVITSNYDNETLEEGETKICGMLDVDSDGEDELIIERTSGGLDVSTTTLEIYKQKKDGNWTLIKKLAGG